MMHACQIDIANAAALTSRILVGVCIKPGPHLNAATRLSGVPRYSSIVRQRSDNDGTLPNASASRRDIDAAFRCVRGFRIRQNVLRQVTFLPSIYLSEDA